jgi:outer membrane protein assembly factor BamC
MEVNVVNKSFKLLALSGAMLSVVACSSYDKAIQEQKVAYRKAEKRESGLEVPPDLTAQSADEQFAIPSEGGAAGVVSASSYYSKEKGIAVASNMKSEPVLVPTKDIKIRKVGKIRSLLVTDTTAEKLWPTLRQFWKSNGFELPVDDPRIGVMETDWLENRAAIPLDGVRKVIGKVFDGIYSSNQRDRYRTRVEPVDGGVEVFITHRGMEENYTDKSQTSMKWMDRPVDPELEAEMLNRLMVKLTGDEEAASKAGREVTKQLITVQKDTAGAKILLAESFPSAWRRVGLGLDRSGFIVEDRDRSSGVYYVKFNPDSASGEGKKSGFFGKLFGGKDESLQAGQRLQVVVEPANDNESIVKILSEKGAAINPKTSEDVVNKLSTKLQ